MDFPVPVFHSVAVPSALAVSIRVPYVAQNDTHTHTHTHTHNIQIKHTAGTKTHIWEGKAEAADLEIESNRI